MTKKSLLEVENKQTPKAGGGDEAIKRRSERMTGPLMIQSHYNGFPLLIIGGEIWSWSLLSLTQLCYLSSWVISGPLNVYHTEFLFVSSVFDFQCVRRKLHSYSFNRLFLKLNNENRVNL